MTNIIGDGYLQRKIHSAPVLTPVIVALRSTAPGYTYLLL
jgi:hypothetical protein